MAELLTVDERGIHCPAGGFHVDPVLPVPLAVITHAHGDHTRPGSASYLCAEPSAPFLRKRLGEATVIRGVPYGEPVVLGSTKVSLHPAGHILGSAQVRIEAGGERCVIAGDYKRDADPTCAPFEVVPCDTFVTEATFGLPIYRWPAPERVITDLMGWWEAGRAAGTACVLFGYAMGKLPRILAELARRTDRTVLVHGAVEGNVELYRQAGVSLLPTRRVAEEARRATFAGELILAPPYASGSTWMRRFGPHETALASGWMRVGGTRRRKGLDRGFVLSDHADWPALLRTIEETGARRVLVMHGYAEELSRYLRDRGVSSAALPVPEPPEPGEAIPSDRSPEGA